MKIIMNQNTSWISSWKLGVAVGAVAFGLVYLPAALAGDKVKECKPDQTKMCDTNNKPVCIQNVKVDQKQDEGFTFPSGGGNSPCATEPASPT